MSTAAKQKKQQPLVRIDQADKSVLDELSAKTGESAPKVLHRALVQYRKQVFFQQMNEAYARARTNTKAWAAEMEERELLDKASSDGLE